MLSPFPRPIRGLCVARDPSSTGWDEVLARDTMRSTSTIRPPMLNRRSRSGRPRQPRLAGLPFISTEPNFAPSTSRPAPNRLMKVSFTTTGFGVAVGSSRPVKLRPASHATRMVPKYSGETA